MVFNSFTEVKKQTGKDKYDLVIIDGPAMISAMTAEIAKEADYIIQPVKPYLDDLEPAVIDYNSLVNEGIDKKKLLIVLNQVININSEKGARLYLSKTP